MSAPHLLHVFATFTAAGPQVRVARLIEAFGDAYRHSIVAMDGRTDARDLLPAVAAARVLDAPPRGTLARLRHLRRLLRSLQPDLLLTYNWGSFDAVLLARTPGMPPHVHHEDGFNHDEAVAQKPRRVLARRLLLPHARQVVVCSHRLLAIARDAWRLPADRVTLIQNGIAATRFQGGDRQRARARLDIPHHALVIGAVGHLRPVKNFARLIRAVAPLAKDRLGARPVHVLLVGDGELRAELESLGRTLAPPGGRVHFAGHQRELRDLYAAMDLFALTSDSEQHPVALLEAMAAGLAVVATDVGDVRPVLPPAQHRYVVPLAQADQNAVTVAIEELLASPDLRDSLGASNARRVVETCSFDAMVAAYRQVYGNALRARGTA